MNEFQRQQIHSKYSQMQDNGYSADRESERLLSYEQMRYYQNQNNPWPESTSEGWGGTKGVVSTLLFGLFLLYAFGGGSCAS